MQACENGDPTGYAMRGALISLGDEETGLSLLKQTQKTEVLRPTIGSENGIFESDATPRRTRTAGTSLPRRSSGRLPLWVSVLVRRIPPKMTLSPFVISLKPVWEVPRKAVTPQL